MLGVTISAYCPLLYFQCYIWTCSWSTRSLQAHPRIILSLCTVGWRQAQVFHFERTWGSLWSLVKRTFVFIPERNVWALLSMFYRPSEVYFVYCGPHYSLLHILKQRRNTCPAGCHLLRRLGRASERRGCGGNEHLRLMSSWFLL